MSPTVVLITGANRGLGEGIIKRYLAKPNHTVIAANRNPDDPTSKALSNFPIGPGSSLIVVKIDATSETDAPTAIQELKGQGINHLDIVIANAAFIVPFVKIEDAKIADLRVNFETNIYGFFMLYQATLPLLLKSQRPTWITIGSGAGSIVVSTPVSLIFLTQLTIGGSELLYPHSHIITVSTEFTYTLPVPKTQLMNLSNQLPVPNAVYGPTKAAQHWLTKRINAEEERICAFIMSPGWVQTPGGNSSAQMLGLKEAPQPVDETCDGMVAVFDKAGKETHGGKFLTWEGKEESW
ncbi:hypothetical protein VE01_02444 [Pseudogymnoascus verrucosus]|uniref:NAD(P)-binding protein n=1 Tax=Pseudogymnoascus verrucosus TaxID=342668 RepID=A0A1B8GT33_9PEZI|nr:uncharacterized protein VE01_02444 [Pseudogymnoascus verrucosus]OBT98981.1 hypothetical protein VE01_02444 [Pseudogymnoascus verrucosus]